MSFVAVVLLRRDGVESVVNVLEVKSDNTLGDADAMCIHVEWERFSIGSIQISL